MLRLFSAARRLLNSRRGAVAAIVAVLLPTLLIASALALETASIAVRQAQLQKAADAIAGAARQTLDATKPTPPPPNNQTAVVTEAVKVAGYNGVASALTPANIQPGWWCIPLNQVASCGGVAKGSGPAKDRFSGPLAGQTGDPFSNAIRITLQETHQIAMGALLGFKSIVLTAKATAYKCSNYDYPYTLVPDDLNPPLLPAMYMSYATKEHTDPNSSYYYLQPDGSRNPVIKFYSPYDDQDVSFVITLSTGEQLQVDTYCRGTFLVAPAAFDWSKQKGPVTGKILRGSTNNSVDTYPDQTPYKFDSSTATYYVDAQHNFQSPQLDPKLVHTTHYPNASGHDQYWASESTPTPDRRSLLVR